MFNSISVMPMGGVIGHLPLEIGNLTELNEIDIRDSDLSEGLVPDSIGLCTKLITLRLPRCKLKGEFPVGLRTLKSLEVALNLKHNSFSGNIPEWIGSLKLLRRISIGENDFSGELPIGICSLINLEELLIHDNPINGTISSYSRLHTRMHRESHKIDVALS
jgi:Leucine-rich repeat (LRR) protein